MPLPELTTPTATTPDAPQIGLLIASTRPVRVCDQLGGEIARVMGLTQPGAALTTIDLRELALPFLDEPRMPSLGGYAREHTRQWAATISALDAIVFLTPQYNWGYPAPLKNAIDYLYAEWRDLPGLVISYGSHGGNKCNDQITQVLDRVRVDLVKPGVCVVVPADAYGPDDHLTDPGAVLAPAVGEVTAQLGELVGRALGRARERRP